MKKIAIGILLIHVVCVSTSCKKTPPPPVVTTVNQPLANGLPNNPKLINGYLFNGYLTYTSGSSNISQYAFSVFSDPTKPLINSFNHYQTGNSFSNFGNIDLGTVTFNGQSLFKTSQSNFSLSYYYTYSYSTINYNAIWTTEGNGVFKPLNINVNRGLPVFSNSITVSNSIAKNADYTLNLGTGTSNYDSLIVILSDGNFNGNIRKVVTTGASSVTFKSQELYTLNSSSYGYINIYAFNYSNTIINDKIYIFELANKLNYSNINLY